ncbi:MAG: peptide ABC transporter permease [Deltaproteobacteria bacterium CG11_big_fil_rev_8_21_14_0_20_45_16]|nr:MAG: peptide ABC transporter permease [Deltaproteobacteria bacterium CG11_big_fil_rev_8_21_14_0_20_45_16]
MNKPQDFQKGNSLWKDAFKRLIKNKAAVAGFLFFVCMLMAAVMGPIISPFSYEFQDLDRVNNPPIVRNIDSFEMDYGLPLVKDDYVWMGGVFWNSRHWFGTDDLGRDMLTRLLFGARVSLAVGFLAGLVSLLIGVLFGSIAGYVGGRLDNIMMRFVDLLYSMPYMFFVILLMAMAGRHFVLLFVAIGAVSWLTTARIVRGQVITLKNLEFVEAAYASGTGHWGIIVKHLIPNTLGPIIVYFSLLVPRVMLEESFLSFIGLGVQAPMSSWGSMVADARSVVLMYPYMVIIPGLALTLTLFSLNFLGDGLRDALDPRLKGKQ